jgi:CBS domain-containing protein
VANSIVAQDTNIAVVVDEQEILVGIVTAFDIVKSIGLGKSWDQAVIKDVMNPIVISVCPQNTLSDLLSKLEENQISAMPVVEQGKVLGMVTPDLLAYRYLQRFLQAEE